MSTQRNAAEVIIVGGGPVGLGLAIDLGQRGVRCLLVERRLEPQPIPKGQNLTQRTLEHFYFWGAEPELRAARVIPRDYGIGGVTAYGTLLGGYAYDWLQRELVRPYYFTDNERLPQYATEAVLRRRLTDLPAVTALYGSSVEAVGQDQGGAWADVVAADGEGRRLTADYLVGCDGGRSIVRTQAGIGQTLSDHDRRMALVVFRSAELHRLLEVFPGKSFFNVLNPALDGYWQFFGRVDLGTTWFFHAPVPGDATADTFDFAAYLQAAVGAPFDVAFDYVGFWDLRFALADAYGQGALFIAGDAAHTHPPYGGYGVNTGLEDAANLGWKLAATLRGWAGPGLLQSYDQERRPVFASTARDFIEKAIQDDRAFLKAFDPARDRSAFEAEWRRRQAGARAEVGAFEPNYEGSPIVRGPGGVSSAVGVHAFDARPGHHLAPQPLSDGRNVFEALGPGFTLLALDADEARVAEFMAAAANLNIPLTVVKDRRDGGRERYKSALVLVRPDQFVAWTAAPGDPATAMTIMRRAIGAGS